MLVSLIVRVENRRTVLRGRALSIVVFAAAVGAALGAASARAAQCGEGADGFNEWLNGFRQVAASDGISPGVMDAALTGVVYDPSVLAHDHGQGLNDSFASFA